MNQSPASQNFHPPTEDQLREHLEAYPAGAPSPWLARLPLIALVVIAASVFLLETSLALTLPWLLLGALFVFMASRARRLKLMESRVRQCQELAMCRHYRSALSRAWRLLPQLTRQPMLYSRTVAILGHCLDDLGAYEPAIEAYDHLLSQAPKDDPGTTQLQTHRAIAALGCDRLADADDALRQVRYQLDTSQRTPLTAAYHFATLMQEVRTHHYAEATERGEEVLEALRPLGAEAGFGHALMALSHHQQAQRAASRETPQTGSASGTTGDTERTGPPSGPDHAALGRRWWDRATLLLPPAALVHRFPELRGLAEEMRDD